MFRKVATRFALLAAGVTTAGVYTYRIAPDTFGGICTSGPDFVSVVDRLPHDNGQPDRPLPRLELCLPGVAGRIRLVKTPPALETQRAGGLLVSNVDG